jgi:sulfide:quinone oxidoreductase
MLNIHPLKNKMLKRLVIAGGGAASSAIAGHLVRSGKISASDMLIIEPSSTSYYQPGFTMVAGGIMGDMSDPENPGHSVITHKTRDMFPSSIEILPEAIKSFQPTSNQLTTSSGATVTYDHLIVALGIQLDYDSIPGLHEALKDPTVPVGSIYKYEFALKMNRLVSSFNGGKAVFHIPPQPIKCAGAPQKIMYLSKDVFDKKKIKYSIDYYMAQPAIFSVPKYAKRLTEIAIGKGINLHYEHTLKKVDKFNRVAVFVGKDGKEIVQPFDLLHVPPPQKPVEALRGSELSDSVGFVTIDKDTLRHVKFPNVWALGDCTNLPTSKTFAAAMSQTAVLKENFERSLEGKDLKAKYNGYTSCPIFVGQHKLMLCEFKYGGELDESFSKKQEEPSRFFYLFKLFGFPFIYKHFLKRGWWYGRSTFFKPKF